MADGQASADALLTEHLRYTPLVRPFTRFTPLQAAHGAPALLSGGAAPGGVALDLAGQGSIERGAGASGVVGP